MLRDHGDFPLRWLLLAAWLGLAWGLAPAPAGSEPALPAADAEGAVVDVVADAVPWAGSPRQRILDAPPSGDPSSTTGPFGAAAVQTSTAEAEAPGRAAARERSAAARNRSRTFLQRVSYRPTGPPSRIG